MADVDLGPDNPSSDHAAMSAYWSMVETINGGAEAMRAAGSVYLPKFPNESQADYDHRKNSTPFTNIYADVSKNLASKPFSRELTLKEGAAASLKELTEDIDGQGNNLHIFASTIFHYGLDKAIDWILVDYSKAPVSTGKPRSVAEEKAAGLRPYWVHVSAERLLAVYTDVIDGVEHVVHARIQEDVTDRSGWGEDTKCRVRVFDRAKSPDGAYAAATYQVFEKQDVGGKPTWVSIEGPSGVTIGIIPLVPFLTGKRIGSTWQVRPPLRDIAHLQVEEFQQESNLKSIMELTCFPMLSGSGVTGTTTDEQGRSVPIRVPVGPKGVLFAPMDSNGGHGEWKFIEPSAQSIKALMDHLDATQKNMRDLGMQPLTTSNLTVITTANVSMKAHSAVQAWALGLKDALEQAFKYTALWLGDGPKAPEVDIYTDFGVDMEAGTELESLLKAQAQGVLSKRTVQEEYKRRGVLSDNFDPDDEEKQLATEEQGLEPEVAIDPVTGEPVEPSTRPKVLTPLLLPGRTPPTAN